MKVAGCGALGSAGKIEVVAKIAGGEAKLRWIERSDKPVGAHQRSGGQGLRLMQRILGAQGGTFAIDWFDQGLEATITLPRR